MSSEDESTVRLRNVNTQSRPVVKKCSFIPGCSRGPLSSWRQNVYKDFRVLPQSLQANAWIVGYIKLGQGRFLSHPFGFITTDIRIIRHHVAKTRDRLVLAFNVHHINLFTATRQPYSKYSKYCNRSDSTPSFSSRLATSICDTWHFALYKINFVS